MHSQTLGVERERWPAESRQTMLLALSALPALPGKSFSHILAEFDRSGISVAIERKN